MLFTYRYRAVPATLSLTPSSVMDGSMRAAVLLLLLGLSWSSCSPASGCRLRIPPHDQVARVARFVAHQCDWASMATISTHKPVVGQPFSNAFSVSDGPEGASSGVPYMYLTRMEISVQDLEVRSQNSTSCKVQQHSFKCVKSVIICRSSSSFMSDLTLLLMLNV